MERQDFINTITELKTMISSLKLTIDTLRETISLQNATIASLQESMDRLRNAYDKAVRERDDLGNRINRSNQETYGSKSLKQSGRGKTAKTDRQKERDEWSSKDDGNALWASSSSDSGVDRTKVKSENLNRSGRNGMKYNHMNAAKRPNLNTIPSTHCTPEFLSDLVVDHFILMTPIYRQFVHNVIDKLQISRNTSRNRLARGAKMLTPVLHLLRERLLEAKSILNIDETWTKVRIKFKGDNTRMGRYLKKYVWVLVNKAERIIYFFSMTMTRTTVVEKNYPGISGHYPVGWLCCIQGTYQGQPCQRTLDVLGACSQ